jgi:hypothetical protein
LQKSTSIKGFMKGTTLFQWPWRSMAHLSDMDCFIRECACLFHDRRSRGHLSLPFCIQFFKQCVSIVLECALAFAIKKKIVLTGDVYSKPPITIKSHVMLILDLPLLLNLMICMQATLDGLWLIDSYHKRD